MASILRTPAPLLPHSSGITHAQWKPPLLLLRRRSPPPKLKISPLPSKPLPFSTFLTWASYEEATETDQVEETAISEQDQLEDETKSEQAASDGGAIDMEEKSSSVIPNLLQSYKQALANDDQTTIDDVENFFRSLEDEKDSLAEKVASLSTELSSEKDRVLRISADFDNFRKRTERERLSLMTNAQGEVVESLLPVLDNFERAKTQIKLETEGEEKINNGYQSIYKQFTEILDSLGVETVETVGREFDPLLHEAIMQEESTEFVEGIILQEFRRGFKLGDRLLRPAMVKVSSGPGPEKTEDATAPAAGEGNGSETSTSDPDSGESA